ncbi:MCP four helix bundle domain-containing protein [Noviherbaspirillum sp. DKR-6]|uniref:MCP four helix bundle domain-containing protein n=1 Tax=Noviherbaspirillum pedocola TaxID=2801341 RepID=A0A934W473_9BURK|nr:MCP four helix bundle domain-containing protein [Noviherbaspirillum pedocola]
MSLLIAVGALGLIRMHQIEARLDHIAEVNMRKMTLLNDMAESVHVVQRVMRTLILLGDVPQAEKEREKIVAARKRYDEAAASLDAMPGTEAGLALRRKARDLAETVRPLNSELVELARAGRAREATEILLKRDIAANQAWIDAIEENVAMQKTLTATDVEAAHQAYHNASTMELLLIALGVAAALLSGWLLSRGLLRQLGGEPAYAAQVASQIAAGDLSVEVHVKPGDRSSLMFAMRTMRDNLAGIVNGVRRDAEAIAAACAQIATGNMDLSARTEQQASSLEETAASVEELTSTVKTNADHARDASALAESASDIAVQGEQAMNDAMHTMDAISESSKRIVDIIGVIDGIAFQTNILALNAAVEAARAGDQGRGFAVVASEVRSLAQRSASAAREIKLLIQDSVGKVASGSEQVQRTGETMRRLVDSVNNVSALIGQITVASSEQSGGIEQINVAIAHIDGVTQQNAALVEQSAAASAQLKDLAQQLCDAVASFRLDSAPHHSAAPASLAPPRAAVPAMVQSPKPPKPATRRLQGDSNARANTEEWEVF